VTKIRSGSSGSIRDRRGQGGGGLSMGGGGFPIPMRAGGGVLGIIVLLATIFLPKLLGGVSGGSSAADVSPSESESAEDVDCPTEIEQIVCGAVDDVQAYWTEQLPLSFDIQYEPTDTVFFTGFTNTGCGQASSQTGPFYCPLDKLVYFDLDFLVQLQDQLEASGDLAAQYIVAHEYGHHIQNVLGINAQMHEAQQNDPDRANQYSIALELQADCFAGAWARDVADEGNFDNPQEVDEALNAAAAVGDDRIQQQTQGRVSPETWTHGSSEQRVEWFDRGFDSADPNTCDTFAEIV
jgi:predicted metalloprotease